MKKWCLFLGLYFCLALLAGCVGSVPNHTEESPPTNDSTTSVTIEDGAPWFMTLRIVEGAETGTLVLAENGEAGSGIYTLSLEQMDSEFQLAEPLRNGQLINVYYEAMTETWPMGFSGVSAIEPVEGGFDNRTTLYLTVLEDLWTVDSALNSDVEYIGMDLTQTSLNPAEQAAVSWVFAGKHGAQPVMGVLSELIEQGWITATPLTTSGSGTDLDDPKYYFYEWENGCHFSIVEQSVEGTYSLTPVTFDAQKWRSSLGAYMFCDCTSVQSALGEWGEYHIGSEVIA